MGERWDWSDVSQFYNYKNSEARWSTVCGQCRHTVQWVVSVVWRLTLHPWVFSLQFLPLNCRKMVVQTFRYLPLPRSLNWRLLGSAQRQRGSGPRWREMEDEEDEVWALCPGADITGQWLCKTSPEMLIWSRTASYIWLDIFRESHSLL